MRPCSASAAAGRPTTRSSASRLSPRPEPRGHHLPHGPRARGKGRAFQPRLRDRLKRRVTTGGAERLRQEGPEARIVVQVVGEAVARDADARLPARALRLPRGEAAFALVGENIGVPAGLR